MHVLFHLVGIITILLSALFCNFYVTHRLITPRHGRRGTLLYMLIHSIILISLSIIGSIAALGGLENSIPILVWVMYGFMILYIPKICYTLVSWLDYLKHPRGKIGNNMGIILAIISLILIIGSTINRYRIHVETCEITTERLPDSFNNYRIVHFSDMHLETLYSHRYAQRVVETINELQPHAIIFSGDMVNRRASELEEYKHILSQLKASDGIYSVMGNHDYGDFVKWPTPEARQENLDRLQDIYTEMGWKLLNNSTSFIHQANDSIAIIGVENWGEPPFQQYGDLPQAYPHLNDKNFKILISHNPRHWRSEILPLSNIDLTLSGHTHAMQMSFANYSLASLRYPEWSGLYNEGEQYLYVNIGIGCTMTPTRLGATPEVTLITLKKAQ